MQGKEHVPPQRLLEAASVLTAAASFLCPHKIQVVPWKSDSNRKAFDFLYSGAQDVNAMENYNMIMQSANYGFQPAYTERFKRRPRVPLRSSPRVLVLAVDAAGGAKDEVGITGMYTDTQGHTVVRVFIFQSSSMPPPPSS